MSRGPRCGAPCPYGGTSAARKYSRADLGHMGHCNRPVRNEGGRCWEHRRPLIELDESPVCVTCRGDEQVPLVGTPGGQFAPCPDCVILGVPRSE